MKISLDNIRNKVNSFFTGVGFENVIRKPTNALYNSSGFFARKIGIVGKNYDLIKSALSKNIGNGIFTYDGYGTPISMLADVESTENSLPWYKVDKHKESFSNYLDYVNDIYFDGYMAFPNFMTIEDKAKMFSPQSLYLENNMVGVVRNYDITDNLLASRMFPNGVQSNPNSYLDTKLGAVNNFYLNATLNNAYDYYFMRNGKGISSNAYDLFGLLGSFGMKNGEIAISNGSVMPQGFLTGSMFSSTPFDYGYGIVDSVDYSIGLIDNASYPTSQFIKRSLLGYDLLSDNDVEISDYDITDYTNITGKKYYPTKGNSYISKIADSIGFDFDVNSSSQVRYNIDNAGYGNSKFSRTSYVYAEFEGTEKGMNSTPYTKDNQQPSYNEGVYYNSYTTYNKVIGDSTTNKKDIIGYTNRLFLNGMLGTLIGRFHTNKEGDEKLRDALSSATSQYGISHGRNLLKLNHVDLKTNGYSDPYCRVWTFHNQYSKLNNLIRPFYDEKNKIEDSRITEFQPYRYRLEKFGVRDESNRLIRIAPTAKEEIKKCMFSIENLAWKHERNGFNGHEDQRGPFGGRIMWFPPYGLNFSENVNVQWSDSQFIGRGEKIYTYTNTDRSGTLSFKLLIDHPSVLDLWKKDGDNVTPKTDNVDNNKTKGGIEQDSVDDVNSMEQKILRFFAGCETIEKAPIVESKPKKKESPKEVIIPEEPKKEPILVPHTMSSTITFYVFYPNNYSGVDDWKGSKVKPMEYLLNGIGCQKNNNEDICTDLFTNYTQSGYECGKGSGISCGLNSVITSTTIDELTTISTYKTKNKNGGTNYWGYRVDERYKDEVFRNNQSYFDSANHGLNASGYTELTQYHTEAKPLQEEGTLFSFVDVACALMPQAKNVLPTNAYNNQNVEYLKQLFEEYDVLSVHTNGFASSHGYVSNNNVLNKNRAENVNRWLQECMPIKFTKEKCKVEETKIGPKLSHNNANDIAAKVWRGAKCTIYLEKEELIEQQRTNSSNDGTYIRVGTQGYEANKVEGLTNVGAVATESAIINADRNANKAYDKATDDTENAAKTKPNGYGKEYEFFSKLKSESTFLHNKIVDKIKYFDPAYHSITPEGFNARLTFLHQCTRQGATHSAMDLNGTRTASNLSFGAPPICVLRIGDFYYTKIIIESLSIETDDLLWDMNDEGIGMMPMMANINISFKFLGGSDLAGPISRLQNAVSFNYYANTSVYDDRSEIVEYDEKNGEIKSFKKNQ